MDKMVENKVLTVNNKIEELTRVERFLEELAHEWNLPEQLVLSLNLVLEEALTNTILYGFHDEDNHVIEILFNLNAGLISITISDDADEYDPTQKSDPDILLPAEERPVGGLGIYLIRKIMDSVQYKRINNINNLILTKNI
jgi:anti-sigma regulatory factor (Ser/Thr protein kinase)